MLKRVFALSLMLTVLYCPLSNGDVIRYSETGNVTLLLTGNSLGLSGANSENGPGIQGSIHTFSTLDDQLSDDTPSNPSNAWPANTTYSYTRNGSDAQLLIPAGATVAYAELIWGGSFRYLEDVETHLDDAVFFTTPGSSTSVQPSVTTAVTLDFTADAGNQVAYYIRSADVTELVSTGGSGTYSLESVPGTQHELINSSNAAGWVLVVAVTDSEFACQNVELRTIGQWVDETQSTEILFSGLSAKSSGSVNGRLLAGAIEGDANRVGDTIALLSPGGISFNTLSTPNNPASNFFASQINTVSGVLDSLGSWGSSNHNAISGINVPGGRQGWDITGIPLQSSLGHLANGQTQTRVRASTSGDEFVLTFLALEVESDPSVCFVEDYLFSDSFEGLGEGSVCAVDAQCADGLLCCYPCGVEGCENQCTVPMEGRCPLFP